MVGGMADGMRLLEVRNGKGLEFTVVPCEQFSYKTEDDFIIITAVIRMAEM